MGRKVWTEKQEKFLKDNMELSIIEVCEILGKTRDSVVQKLSRLGLHRRQPFTRKEDRFIEDNYYILTWDEMSLKLDRPTGSIRHRAESLGLKDEGRNLKIQRKVQGWYSFNEDYFSKPNLNNSYWAGLLAADGNINKITRANGSHRWTLQLVLHSKDREHILKFSRAIEYTGPVRDYVTKEREYKGKLIKSSPMSQIRINITEKVVMDLKNNFNIIPAKSLILEPPNLGDKKLILSYCIGLLDGDGTLSRTNSRDSIFWYLSFNGTRGVLEFVKTHFDFSFPHSSPFCKPACVNDTPYNMCNYKIKGERALRIADNMLRINTPRLSRKWEPYVEDRRHEKEI